MLKYKIPQIVTLTLNQVLTHKKNQIANSVTI